MTVRTVALAVGLLTVLGCSSSSGSKPIIVSFSATPASLTAGGGSVTLAWDVDAVKALFPPILAARDAIFPALFAAVLTMIVVSFFTPKPAPEQLAQFES